MDALLKKLNYKAPATVYVLHAPQELQHLPDTWSTFANLETKTGAATVQFALAFCTTQQQVDDTARQLNALAEGDAVLWFCYPKGSSKRYKCDFNRDTGWQLLGQLGWEPVRQVAINEDWSALRFRKASFIKTMTRSFAISSEGKAKVSAAKKKS